jgi:thiol-disulfide isomerase/thioredoxin
MKNRFHFLVCLVLIILCLKPFTARADWFEVNCTGKVLAVSRIAKVGKISVFIISTPWCAPCKMLKDKLMDNSDINMELVDIYYVLMTDNNDYDELKQTESYKVWREVEQLDAWPYVYITAPTTNIVSNFSPTKEKNTYDRIMKVINALGENTNNFNDQIVADQKQDITIKKIDRPFRHYSKAEEESNSYEMDNHNNTTRNGRDFVDSNQKESHLNQYSNQEWQVNHSENNNQLKFQSWHHGKDSKIYNSKKGEFLRIEFPPSDKIEYISQFQKGVNCFVLNIKDFQCQFDDNSIRVLEKVLKHGKKHLLYGDQSNGDALVIEPDPGFYIKSIDDSQSTDQKSIVDIYFEKHKASSSH